MEKLSQKQMLNRLNEILDGLKVEKETIMVQTVDANTKVVHEQARNMRKTMIKMFKELDYDRQVLELMALEARLDYELAKPRE